MQTDTSVTRNINIAFLTHDDASSIAGTTWAKQVLEEVPHDAVASTTDAHIVVIADLTTNDGKQNQAVIDRLVAPFPDKPVCVFLHDDPETAMKLKRKRNIAVFRTSLCKSTKQPYEFAMPSFQAVDARVELLPAASCDTAWKPKIGFCGVGKWPSRQAALDAFSRRPELFDTRFVLRADHHTRLNQDEQASNKAEFEDIMLECPYQLCGRGGGNFSHRFYETLAAGRIPVLIDTDCEWPIVNVPLALWNRCVVIANDAPTLVLTLLRFHAEHDLATTQVLCRHLWEHYFSVQGYAPVVESVLQHLVSA